MIRSLLGFGFLILALADVSAGEPRLVRVGDAQLVLHDLPAVLDDDEIRPHLMKGLTTTFLIVVELRAGARRIRGGARVEVRYELWDERFEVVVYPAAGPLVRKSLVSPEALSAWWRGLRLVVVASGLDPPASPRGPPLGEARVELQVVPFSQAEQNDAQRWFSETLDQASSGSADEVARSADRSTETLNRTLHLLMATSIQRRALVSRRWTLPVETAADREAPS